MMIKEFSSLVLQLFFLAMAILCVAWKESMSEVTCGYINLSEVTHKGQWSAGPGENPLLSLRIFLSVFVGGLCGWFFLWIRKQFYGGGRVTCETLVKRVRPIAELEQNLIFSIS